MPSMLRGYEYDIFISYRQNDNRYDGWVTEFVDNLQKELDATLKNKVSIYFDENPHDGLQESHSVDLSLAKKLKCLIFIPILSQTYCDENSFAWQHEFVAFHEMASAEDLGLSITLRNGNVANRILPIQIHDIDTDDQKKFENITGAPIRAIEFIYKEAGVNRSLKPTDEKKENLNETSYRNQMNKVAHALKDLGTGILRANQEEQLDHEHIAGTPQAGVKTSMRGILIGSAIIILLFLGYWGSTNYFTPTEKATEKPMMYKSIAVLPFTNTKPDTETDYLGFAIANQVIGELAYFEDITIRPSASIRKYSTQIVDPFVAGQELSVDYILIGNYLNEAENIRLTIELVEVSSTKMMWREEIHVDFKNAFELQDIVAKRVVDGLNVQLSQKEKSRIGKNIPGNSLAYEYYLRGVSYPLSNEGDQLAIEMLKRSIEIDSGYAPSYYELGVRTQRITQFGMLDSDDVQKAEAYYLKALSIDSELIGVIGDLATLYTEIGRTDEATDLGRQLLEINPNNAVAHFSLSYTYRYAGMISESFLEMERAIVLDSKNPRFRRLGLSGLYYGDYKKAYIAYDFDKGSAYALSGQGRDLFRQGKTDEAMEHFDRVIAMEPEVLWILVTTVLKSCILKDSESGLEALKLLEEANPPDGEALYLYAGYAAMLGDNVVGLRLLGKAINGGYFNYPFMLTDTFIDALRDEEEFKNLLQQAKEKHEVYKKKYF